MSRTDRVMTAFALPLLVVSGMVLIGMLIVGARNVTDDNNAYIRVINCIVSHNASERTQEDIESCYDTVERDTGIKLQRFDERHR